MQKIDQIYINGQWVTPHGTATFTTINPATEEPSGILTLGDAVDVDAAVKAAREAFKTWSLTSRETRLELLERIKAGIDARVGEIGEAISAEMGAPINLARSLQGPIAGIHTQEAINALRNFEFEKRQGRTLIDLVPIGVCGLITPWNWPAGTLMSKVVPALATGCTIVLKPSEFTPYSAKILCEVMHDAGLPPGVFNMVYGDGAIVGEAISSHPDVDMVSITGSTRAGIAVARTAAATVKRVHQELGGKSANIVLPSADLAKSVTDNVKGMAFNAAQNCSAATRLLVQNKQMAEAKTLAAKAASEIQIGMPNSNADLAAVANKNQFDRIQSMIQKGIDEGATLVCGGTGRPEGFEKGYFCQLTVFADTTPDMSIVKEEIFGPVFVMQGYETVDDAVEMANATDYGLAAYVQGNLEEARDVAKKLLGGQVYINAAADSDFAAPFGGFKRSGNGREWGASAFEAYLEPRSIVSYFDTGEKIGLV